METRERTTARPLAASPVASSDATPDPVQVPDPTVCRRLLVEAAIRGEHLLRLERPVGSGRIQIRLVRPTALEPSPDADRDEGVLAARLATTDHVVRVRMADAPQLSIASEHMPRDRSCAGDVSAGDGVLHDALGFGVVMGIDSPATAVVLLAEPFGRVERLDPASLRPMARTVFRAP